MNLSDILNLRSSIKYPHTIRVLSEAYGADDAFCIIYEDTGIWRVYYVERGIKSFQKEFKAESEACEYLYKLISEYGLLNR